MPYSHIHLCCFQSSCSEQKTPAWPCHANTVTCSLTSTEWSPSKISMTAWSICMPWIFIIWSMCWNKHTQLSAYIENAMTCVIRVVRVTYILMIDPRFANYFTENRFPGWKTKFTYMYLMIWWDIHTTQHHNLTLTRQHINILYWLASAVGYTDLPVQ